MSVPMCRKNDITFGICLICRKPTAGKIDTASENVMVNGKGAARDTDIVRADGCGHTGTIKTTSTTMVNGKSVAKVGDMFSGDYFGVLGNGSPDVNTG